MQKEDLSTDTTLDPYWFALDYTFKDETWRRITFIVA